MWMMAAGLDAFRLEGEVMWAITLEGRGHKQIDIKDGFYNTRLELLFFYSLITVVSWFLYQNT